MDRDLGPRSLARTAKAARMCYTQANGLSGDFVTRLFEDREGNVWVATKNGLDRFRNLAVRTISTNQGLPSAPPWSVLAASDGSVWFGSLDGLSRWNGTDVTIYRSPGNGSPKGEQREAPSGGARKIFDSGLPDDGVGVLFEDGDGRLWVSTLRGIAYFENGRFIPVSQLPGGRTSSIAADGAKSLWIANEANGLYRLRGGRVVEQIPWAALTRGGPATTLLLTRCKAACGWGFKGAWRISGTARSAHRYTAADGFGRRPCQRPPVRRE